ncbi:MAG: circularly permuted type 2 ATP-grasp protein [Propionibacteriaceae bacterium]|jgi:uncharacterized circularly permuted ATP-grasp superfamily protein/uncharacterized alpha-E superfamily protein|nr:circularly permuted type 2 ATP-grasp protein [Propionibacteriaceae bacterium]
MSLALDSPSWLAEAYAAHPDLAPFDELLAAPAMAKVGEYLAGATLADLRMAVAETRNLVADDGIVFGAADRHQERPWRLDPLPVVIGDWRALQHGLAQRARLLQAVFDDLYGERALLASGAIPPELVLGNPAFRRFVERPRKLLLAAFDLGRDEAGNWRVHANRCETPAGMGYAMANRRVVSQVLAGLHRQTDLRRLRGFFHTSAAALLDSGAGETPRVVILTPGTHSDSAFDQGFLATLLGFALAEADDLVTKRGRVWLRGEGRLEPVEVVLRRVADGLADPLEFPDDSEIGVPGLAEAERTGAVTVANPIGAGILDSPDLPALLPALSRELLGEELLLPSAAGPLALSSVPVVTAEGLEPRRFLLRVFGVATADGWHFLPGGLGCVAERSADRQVTRMSMLSKDVWVLPDPAEAEAEVLPSAPRPLQLSAAGPVTPITPRVAGTLMAIGRFAERAQAKARLIRVADDVASDHGAHPGTAGHGGMLVLLGALAALTGYPSPGPDPAAVTAYLHRAALDAGAGSMRYDITRLLANSQQVRDLMSSDAWSIFGRMQRHLATAGPDTELAALMEALLESLLAWSGIMAESMVRDSSWAFLDAGARLERARHTLTLLRHTHSAAAAHGDAVAEFTAERVLQVCESIITHRRRVIAGLGSPLAAVSELALLLEDPSNPRSLAFQLRELAEDLDLAADAELAGRARTLDTARGASAELDGWLDSRLADLGDIERAIGERHFSRQSARQVTEAR